MTERAAEIETLRCYTCGKDYQVIWGTIWEEGDYPCCSKGCYNEWEELIENTQGDAGYRRDLMARSFWERYRD